ncbi:N-6 DNA methylase, partial [Acetobacterium fimetarium]
KLTNDGNNEGLEKYEESLKQKTKPYFLWKLEFAKIFKEKGGFDIVIGNPPYGAKFSKKDKQYLAAKYPTVPDYESANYFVEKGYELLRTSGVLSFIIPNMFMSNVFAKKYRATLVNSWSFLAIDNLSSIEVFDSAKVRNCIILFEKERLDFETKLTKLTIVKKNIAISKEKKVSKEKLIELIDNWLNILEQSEEQLIILKKVLENSTPLGELAEISQGLIPYDKYRGHTEETIKNRIWHASYQKDHTYRRELAGKDVDRYSVKWNNEKWISYGEWLAAPRKQEFFTSPRILIREITNPKILAGYTIDEYYNTPSIINCINFTVNTNYILGIVNSMLMTFYHKLSSPKSNKGIFPK